MCVMCGVDSANDRMIINKTESSTTSARPAAKRRIIHCVCIHDGVNTAGHVLACVWVCCVAVCTTTSHNSWSNSENRIKYKCFI